MIVYTGDDAKPNRVDAKRYDGIYYAIIINSYLSSNHVDYKCYVYIPEIFPDSNIRNGALYYRCYDFPHVNVPVRSDSCKDESGNLIEDIPSIGQLIKVSFDDGDINSCRFVSYVPLEPIYENINKNFILNGIIPSDVVYGITDEEILKTFRPLIPLANYITTGEEEPSAEHYKYKFVFSNTDTGRDDMNCFFNWFTEALTMPLHSMFKSGYTGGDSAIVLPYYSTDIYGLYYVMQNVVAKGYYGDLNNLYTHIPSCENLGSDYYMLLFDNKETKITESADRAKVAAVWILGLFSGYGNSTMSLGSGVKNYEVSLADMAFPEVTAEFLEPFLGHIALSDWYSTVPELFWLYMSYGYDEGISAQDEKLEEYRKYRVNNILHTANIKKEYETHYVSCLATWSTAINNLTTDEEMRNVILMCLTIAPWFAAPLLLYKTGESKSVQSMSIFLNSLSKNDSWDFYVDIYNDYVSNADSVGNVENSAVFPNANAYTEFSNTLQPYIISNDKKGFVDRFQELTKEYLGKKLKDSAALMGDLEYAYAGDDFDAKFQRLRDRMSL